MNMKVLAFAALSLIAIAGCKPQASTEPVAPAEAVAAETMDPATAGTDAIAVTEAPVSSAEAGAFDVKAFAGTFTGTLPCASCPGIDTTLELSADGSFKLIEKYQDEAGEPATLDGTWTAEDNGKRVLLDPNSKAEQDRNYQIVSNDQLDPLGLDGKAIASTLNYSLKRTAVAK